MDEYKLKKVDDGLVSPQNSTIKRKKKRQTEKRNLFAVYKSEKTIKDYMFYLKQFLSYTYEGNGNFSEDEIITLMQDVTTEDVEEYIVYLSEDKGLKNSSINKIISSLKSLYKELERHGLENPVKFIKLLKTTRHNYENVLKVSAKDIREILDIYQVIDEKSYRNQMILYTLYYTGMRSQELINLKYEHIIPRDGEYVIKLVETKSGREQYKPLHSDCVKKIETFKKYSAKINGWSNNEIPSKYIFFTKNGGQDKMSYNSLYSIIQTLGELIDKDISPHNIRHAIATELSLGGADLVEIRDFLGHADTKVTEVYINAKGILEKKALEKIPKL